MATNIAQVIGQGTAQNARNAEGLVNTMQQGAQMQRQTLSDTMAVTKFNTDRLAMIDSKADAWMQTGAYLNNQVKRSKGALDKAMTSADSGAPVTDPAAYAKAQNAYDAAVLKRNDFLKGSMASPRMMGLLQASSYADDELQQQFMSPEVWDSFSDEEKNLISNQAFSYHEAMQEVSQALDPNQGVDYQKVNQKAAESAATTLAKGKTERMLEAQDPVFPDKAGLDYAPYVQSGKAQEVEVPGKWDSKSNRESLLTKWYDLDLAPISHRYGELTRVGAREQEQLGDILSMSPGDALRVGIPKDGSAISQDITRIYLDILRDGNETRRDLFIEKLKPYLNQPVETTTKPRLTAH